MSIQELVALNEQVGREIIALIQQQPTTITFPNDMKVTITEGYWRI